jgi:hypothetical protein
LFFRLKVEVDLFFANLIKAKAFIHERITSAFGEYLRFCGKVDADFFERILEDFVQNTRRGASVEAYWWCRERGDGGMYLLRISLMLFLVLDAIAALALLTR